MQKRIELGNIGRTLSNYQSDANLQMNDTTLPSNSVESMILIIDGASKVLQSAGRGATTSTDYKTAIAGYMMMDHAKKLQWAKSVIEDSKPSSTSQMIG